MGWAPVNMLCGRRTSSIGEGRAWEQDVFCIISYKLSAIRTSACYAKLGLNLALCVQIIRSVLNASINNGIMFLS
jgi:hypothetical protein